MSSFSENTIIDLDMIDQVDVNNVNRGFKRRAATDNSTVPPKIRIISQNYEESTYEGIYGGYISSSPETSICESYLPGPNSFGYSATSSVIVISDDEDCTVSSPVYISSDDDDNSVSSPMLIDSEHQNHFVSFPQNESSQRENFSTSSFGIYEIDSSSTSSDSDCDSDISMESFYEALTNTWRLTEATSNLPSEESNRNTPNNQSLASAANRDSFESAVQLVTILNDRMRYLMNKLNEEISESNDEQMNGIYTNMRELVGSCLYSLFEARRMIDVDNTSNQYMEEDESTDSGSSEVVRSECSDKSTLVEVAFGFSFAGLNQDAPRNLSLASTSEHHLYEKVDMLFALVNYEMSHAITYFKRENANSNKDHQIALHNKLKNLLDYSLELLIKAWHLMYVDIDDDVTYPEYDEPIVAADNAMTYDEEDQPADFIANHHVDLHQEEVSKVVATSTSTVSPTTETNRVYLRVRRLSELQGKSHDEDQLPVDSLSHNDDQDLRSDDNENRGLATSTFAMSSIDQPNRIFLRVRRLSELQERKPECIRIPYENSF